VVNIAFPKPVQLIPSYDKANELGLSEPSPPARKIVPAHMTENACNPNIEVPRPVQLRASYEYANELFDSPAQTHIFPFHAIWRAVPENVATTDEVNEMPLNE
jgi:hypothetical protein